MDHFKIINSNIDDIDIIFSLYDAAVVFQKEKSDNHWQPFSKALVEKEIVE